MQEQVVQDEPVAGGRKKMAKKAAKPDAAKGSARALVIVESPAKAKTINKYLGSKFVVMACKGHVRDLPKGQYAIDPGRNFQPTYEILPSHRKLVSELRHAANDADTVYLATDLDREGEAIAWHLAHALDLTADRAKRVVFNEITKSAIQKAFEHPHEIDRDRVNAQQARRVLDRIVGYELSPLLWKKVAKGLSAGRVQSVAVRMIVDRENEIRAFEPAESWVVDGVFTVDMAGAGGLSEQWKTFLGTKNEAGDGPAVKDKSAWLAEHKSFHAELVEIGGAAFKAEGTLTKSGEKEYQFATAAEKVRPIVEAMGLTVREIRSDEFPEYARLKLKKVTFDGAFAARKDVAFKVREVETKRTKTRPSGPFTTATLQQSAANHLHFAASRTMKTAQALYEGVDLGNGEGPIGLITYMRTDSTHLSGESLNAVRTWIDSNCGPKYLPEKPNFYGSAAGAQEAHEAIRPTDVSRTPDSLKGHLSSDQLKLYTLIWNRFVACQMVPAEWDATTAWIEAATQAGAAVFKASGRVLAFDGFFRIMGMPKSGEEPILPQMQPGQPIAPLDIHPVQKFTQPPARYSEAGLVKALEAEGIGRPSTYAAIIDTIQKRGYVDQVDRRFRPSARGEVVTQKLVAHFPKVMDLAFTRYMEGQLDKIEEAHLDWVAVLHEFYDPFKESLGKAHEEMDAVKAEPSPYTCEKCGKPMVYRLGINGRFLSCTGYPECRAAMNVDADGKPIKPVEVDIKCEKCGKPMQLRRSKRGPFLGCSGYPDCDSTLPCDEAGKPLTQVKPEDVKESCPECNAPMKVNFARGRAFLGCSRYPQCKGTKPIPDGLHIIKPPPQLAGVGCDKCGRPMVIRKSRRGPFLSCSGFPRCRNAKPMEKLAELQAMQAEGKLPTPPPDEPKKGRGRAAARTASRTASKVKVDPATLGAPPPGFAWTRTGRPVVETWPTEPLKCPECGGEMAIKTGRFGAFFGCGNCKATANLRGEAKKRAEKEVPQPDRPKPIETDIACPDCGKKMLLRMGRTGRFLGCSGYPKCRKTMEPPPGLLREVGGNGAG